MHVKAIVEECSPPAKPAKEAIELNAEPVALPPWQPYESQWTETPGFGNVMKVVPRSWYRCRWAASYPLQWRVLGGRCTVGELLFLLLALGYTAGACASTWNDASGSGQAAAIPALYITITLAMRNSIWCFLMGLPFERALFWHSVSAYVAIAVGLYHGLVSWYAVYGWSGWDLSQSTSPPAAALPAAAEASSEGRHLLQYYSMDYWGLDSNGKYFVSGWGLLIAMALMVATSAVPQLRRSFFKLWYYLHIFLAIALIGCTFMHGRRTLTDSLIAVALWTVDLVVRYVWMAGALHPHEVELVALPGGVVQVSWPKKNFQYSGGQYCFLCIPGLSWFEWHPFSLSSHPSEDRVTVHVRCLGRWTRALHQLASKQADGKPLVTRAFIEGPYGSAAADICGDRHDMFLLISGGIGVTPMQSVMNDLISQNARGRSIKFLWFVWSVRDKHMVNTVLDFNKEHAKLAVPKDLPLAFSPNLVSPNVCTSRYLPLLPHSTSAPAAPAPGTQPYSDTSYTSSEAAMEDVELGRCSAGSAPEFLHTEFYLTQARDESQFEDANIAPHKQSALRLGRPDLPKIFSDMAEVAASKNPKNPRVAVLTCGPMPMVNSVTQLCKGNGIVTSSGVFVRFELHKEVFEF